MRAAQPLPQKIQNAPELELGLNLFYNGFWELHLSRRVGLKTMPIGWTETWDYCRRLDLDGDQTDDMLFLVAKMDQAYLEWAERKYGKS